MDDISGKWMKMANKTASKTETLSKISEKQSESRKNYVKLSSLVTEEKYERYIRKHTKEEYEALSKAIAQDGKIRDPLTVKLVEGELDRERTFIVIDGHHRLRAAKELLEEGRLEFEKVPITIEKFANDQEIFVWMLRHQLGRRNLTPFERAEIGFRITSFLETLAQDKKKHKKVDNKLLSKWIKAPETDKIDYAEVVSDLTGVPRTTIIRAKKLHNQADDELKGLIRAGDISISKAYQQLVDVEKQLKKEAQIRQRAEDFQQALFSIKEIENFLKPKLILNAVGKNAKSSVRINLLERTNESLLFALIEDDQIEYVRVFYNLPKQSTSAAFANRNIYILHENSKLKTSKKDALLTINPEGVIAMEQKSTEIYELEPMQELEMLRKAVSSSR
ncbi:ParB/RepB/Spo0J family partition protein [Chondrinema litorale]|uniref:ParB/RepB/Spo0J family partition protein n=1 Tax=Chondrinema litorale TaxID=2994555 RepID=UPI0025431FD3|nr:ParB N-terminal domain-containing protein [Chondrinema litorale]UZR96565.1 ParB N-terminal domain-containing protein [Chondrinema litorale]